MPAVTPLPSITPPPSITHDSEDHELVTKLSCANMWPYGSLVQNWHNVHTKVGKPIDMLFFDLDRNVEK